jgi:phasin
MTDASAATKKPKTPRHRPETVSPSESPKFELPKIEVPAAAFREFAEKGVAQAQDTYAKVTAATAEATSILEETCTSAAQATAECNRKTAEAVCAHTEIFFDFALGLVKAKSPGEFLKVSSDHLSKQLDALTEQAKEFTALAHKAVSETAEPIKTGIQRALKKVA